jgi:single-stranded DNA-binding protein
MQVFGNVATQPERKQSKASGKGYFEFRLKESQRGVDTTPTWYTVRVMKDDNPLLDKGDFVKLANKLKADFYLNREGKPTGTLLIIAFEVSKIAKQVALQEGAESGAPAAPREQVKEKAPAPQQVRPQEQASEKAQVQAQERQQATEPQQEPDWPTLYS